MPEGRELLPRVPWNNCCKSDLAPVQPPRVRGISSKETCNEDRRLKEESEHEIHPVAPKGMHLYRLDLATS
jgi:hypothetical protein